jgi:CubicO group peptidase (beta-lactamase class C family)
VPVPAVKKRLAAGGALNTSVADLANWMRLDLGKGEFEGERLVPAQLIGEPHAPRIYNTVPGFAEFGEAHYGLGFQCQSYRGDRLVFHGGGWVVWGTLMTLVPDFGIGVAVFANRSPSEVPATLTWYVIDRLRGRETIDSLPIGLDERQLALLHHCNSCPGHLPVRHGSNSDTIKFVDQFSDRRMLRIRRMDHGEFLKFELLARP